jgi:hypothetical protein
MEEGKILTISTKIPIDDIIEKVLNNNPHSECEFNNLLIYNFTDILLDKLNIQLQQQRAGKKRRNTKRNRKIKKSIKRNIKRNIKIKKDKKTRKLRNQKGGTDPRILIFFMSMFIVFVKGVQNMTDMDVIKQIKKANQVSELFKNYYGTCTLNTLLFLKTIDIPTFEDLSIDMMTNKPGLKKYEISKYLNKELSIDSRWYSFSGREGDVDELVEQFIDRVRNKLISLRSSYGFPSNQSIITAMSYPKKSKAASHAVVVWLTSKNDIVIIEPQKFLENEIILYTSEITFDRFLFNDRELKKSSLRYYIKKNIDLTSEHRDTDIFESIHIEIDDVYGENNLSQTNQRVIQTIARIKETEENLEDKTKIEEF